MMANAAITHSIIWEGGDACLMARVTLNGANVTQDDLASIARKIFDLDGATPSTAVDEAVSTIASVVFNTLQTDARWSEDETGYNFRDTIGGAEFPEPNRTYRVEYKLVGAAGEIAWLVFELETLGVYSE